MARSARVVVPNHPHHIVQRGNRNQTVFFSDRDRLVYLSLLGYSARKYGVSFLSWCLMDNHVHFIALPDSIRSFAKCFRSAHSRYSQKINERKGWRGHLWQCRFHSSPLGPAYLYNAVRYVEQNPVRAGIAATPWDYIWSSAGYHVGLRKTDPLINYECEELLDISDWRSYLAISPEAKTIHRLRDAAKRNRPACRDWYYFRLRNLLGIDLSPPARGRPSRSHSKYS